MKKIKRWLGGLCCAALLLALLTACGSQTPQQVQPDADGTYSSAVFDTQNDAGCLTVRYLALKETYRANDDKVNVGDCAVYTSPEGLVMMVDCSNPASFPEIDAQLKAMGVEKIDIFVMSHPHADHIGSFAELADNYPIGQVYMNSHEYNSGTYRAAMEAIERNNIPSTILRDGDSFQFGDQVTVKIYNPDAGMEAKLSSEYMDANNCSLAMRLTFGDSSFWTSGDMYSSGEEAMIARYGDELRSDIVKVNHHGYDTSSGKQFIDTLQPILTVSQHESVTSKTVALRFYTSGAQVFYTCMDGTVRVRTSGDGQYDVQSQKIREQTYYGEPAADGHYTVSRAAEQ